MALLRFQDIQLSTTSPNQRQVTELEGVEYVLKFRWRSRSEAWYVSIYTYPEEETIIEGRRLRKYGNCVEFANAPEGELTGVLAYIGPPNPSYEDESAQPFYAYAL